MEYVDLIYKKEAPILLLYLNRPEQKNAFTSEMLKSLSFALEEAQNDDEISVIILTGSGDAFCTGGNIKEMAAGELTGWTMKDFLWKELHSVAFAMEAVDKPIIAAVNGPALGGGMDLALMCDIRIASEGARFCQTYVRIGLAPGDGGAFLLPRLIGPAKAMELLFTGKNISASYSKELGIVNEVVPQDQLLPYCRELAMKMARWPLVSLRMIKRAVYHGMQTTSLRYHLDYISSQVALLTLTKEHNNAIKSLLTAHTRRKENRR